MHPTGADKRHQEKLIEGGEVPKHIAIIMDGNGRWAKRRGLPRIAGHNEGVNSVRDVVEACGQLGVKYLTLYTFSTENWKRPQDEISMLMRLLLRALRDERDRLHKSDVRLTAIGDISTLPNDVREELVDAIRVMRQNKGLNLILALSYSGRWDLTQAIREIADHVHQGRLKPNEITESMVSDHLATSGIPDPDLLIRTSGEFRISNFLLWQIAYSEMVMTDQLWPEFRRKHVYEAITDFQKRERRFGKVSEQLGSAPRTPVHYVERLFKSVAKL
ncbi:MAG: isoprenyl transferase [Ignavibacteriales bacterium]|nr:isoprenyl transferase [Ignavibacteriales bacterium]